MIRTAFCDDDRSELNELQGLLEQYRRERGLELDCAAFQTPLDLLAAVEQGAQFDVLFLDILMPGENGIDTAAEVRRHNSDVKIIFLTSSAEYAVESYTVGAYFYQLKPIGRESLFRLMDSVLAAREREQANSLILRCKSGITRVDLNQLEYCEVIQRTLFFHLSGGQVLECVGRMDELCRQLEPYGNFLRPHRSYLINLDYVHSLSARAATMSCQATIPIPRGKYNEVKDAFLEHAFRNRQILV